MLNPYADSTPSTLTGAMLPTFHMFDALFRLTVCQPSRRNGVRLGRDPTHRSATHELHPRAAAAARGLNKSTVLPAIKAGKISGTKDKHGEWHIEAAELHRVYPPVAAAAAGNGAVIRRSCYNKAHDLEHGFHTPALLGES